jgi:hypothetical protein
VLNTRKSVLTTCGIYCALILFSSCLRSAHHTSYCFLFSLSIHAFVSIIWQWNGKVIITISETVMSFIVCQIVGFDLVMEYTYEFCCVRSNFLHPTLSIICSSQRKHRAWLMNTSFTCTFFFGQGATPPGIHWNCGELQRQVPCGIEPSNKTCSDHLLYCILSTIHV